METFEERRVLATITVTTIDDVVDANDGVTSLREAIDVANIAGGDTINFDPSAPNMNGGTISLELGQIAFGKDLTIDASNLTSGLTINADDDNPDTPRHRIFDITDPTFGSDPPLVTIKGLTLTGGDAGSLEGGAIRSEARLELERCTVAGSQASLGGGVFVQVVGVQPGREILTITDCMIEGNDADDGSGVAVTSGFGPGGRR
jgi:hypothetical protein